MLRHTSLQRLTTSSYMDAWVKDVRAWSCNENLASLESRLLQLWCSSIQHWEYSYVYFSSITYGHHSQAPGDAQLNSWIICQLIGKSVVHFTYMAGLGEAYAHIAGILFYVESFGRINGKSVHSTITSYGTDRLQRSYYSNSFIGRDERACVLLAKTSFVLEPKCVWRWRWMHFFLETKAFSPGD